VEILTGAVGGVVVLINLNGGIASMGITFGFIGLMIFLLASLFEE